MGAFSKYRRFYFEHLVSDYFHIPFEEVLELDYVTFLEFRIEAYVDLLSQCPGGADYLEKCEAYQATEPDINGLKRLAKKLGGTNAS